MTIRMNDDSLITINQLQELIKLSHRAAFARQSRTEAYVWISQTLSKFRYFAESKKHRGIIKAYIRTIRGYSDVQTDRLIQRKKKVGFLFRLFAINAKNWEPQEFLPGTEKKFRINVNPI